MTGSKGLTQTQRSLLSRLAKLEPAPTLFGGAALIAGHTGHRQTRDLDLKWSEVEDLAPLVPEVLELLRPLGHRVEVQRRFATFVRLLVHGPEQVIIDMVAEPAAEVAQLISIEIGEQRWRIPCKTDALADKLCALMSRAELRDLDDVQALLAVGADLDTAIERAPSRDTGFSPYVLAWVLESFPLDKLAEGAGLSEAALATLVEARTRLHAHLLTLADAEAIGAEVAEDGAAVG